MRRAVTSSQSHNNYIDTAREVAIIYVPTSRAELGQSSTSLVRILIPSPSLADDIGLYVSRAPLSHNHIRLVLFTELRNACSQALSSVTLLTAWRWNPYAWFIMGVVFETPCPSWLYVAIASYLTCRCGLFGLPVSNQSFPNYVIISDSGILLDSCFYYKIIASYMLILSSIYIIKGTYIYVPLINSYKGVHIHACPSMTYWAI